MIEVKWYARGGHGAFTASKLMGLASSIHNDSYAQAFPSFGPERRGAPVFAFTRIDKDPIIDHSQLYTYDCAIVMDNTLIETLNVTDGLKDGGLLFINSSKDASAFSFREDISVYTFDATKLAVEILNAPIVNTAMLAVWAAHTDLISLEALLKAVKEGLPEHLQEKNLKVIELAYTSYKEGGK